VSDEYNRDVGISDTVLPAIVCSVRALVVSTTGASPDTVTVSWTPPTRRSPLTVATKLPASSMPSRLTTLNPAR